jgi:transcriptional regulator with XRE-family HTH domain
MKHKRICEPCREVLVLRAQRGYSRGVDELERGSALHLGQGADLPVRQVTVNSIVALNMAYFRKAAGLTQEELGERIGWGKSVVSTAERSWDAKRVRSFSAEDLIAIATALQIPLAALFLPPEDDGTAFDYVVDAPGRERQEAYELLTYAFPTYGGDTPVREAYRKRLIAAGVLDPGRADDIVTASDLLDKVQQLAEEVINQARGDADETLGIVRREADEVLTKARRQAEQITGDARARAESLERDVQERHRQAMGSLVQTREELEQRIDDLRVFEREYRTRLQSFMEGQLLELWTPQLRPEMERALDELRKRAASGEGSRVSAVLLREDGTYDVVQVGREGQDDAQPQEEPQGYGEPPTAEGGSTR